MSVNEPDLLIRFQRHGDVEALIAYGQALGHSEARLRAVVSLLQPIFESLSFGEQPHFENVDREQLLAQQPEISFVTHAMAASEAADLKTAGFHLMGVLDLEPFIHHLRNALLSSHEWERIEAIDALGKMTHPEVRSILESATTHSDPATSEAARKALESFDQNNPSDTNR
jgi:hypothetical protein